VPLLEGEVDPEKCARLATTGAAGIATCPPSPHDKNLGAECFEYQAQADRPFEHEQGLKQLLVRQSELNSQLDLDKGD